MLKVGVTGGIGSGKTLVCEIFKHLGIPVYNADIEAKALLKTTKVIEFYKNTFGEKVVTNDHLDNQKIASLIFSDASALKKVNNFIHPLVFEHFENWCKFQHEVPYVIKEAALLFESGGYKALDYNILVFASIETRISRVMKRNGFSREEVLQRIANQWNDEDKKKYAQFLIENDGNHAILQKILDTHNFLKNQ